MDKSKDEGWKNIQSIVQDAKAKNLPIVGLSSSDVNVITDYAKSKGVSIPFYNTDETTLKTIVRSNPGVLVLEQGTIKEKWHYNTVPSSLD